jgi:tetratricopeptide (TPR) repeat protein
MEVVLANLKRQSPEEIWQGLQLAELADVGDKDKTNNIIKCVEYSHSNLSEEAQKLLLCLAPFSGFICTNFIPQYSHQLQQLEPLQGYQFDQFDAAIEEAIHWGLLSPMSEELPSLLTIQPIFPYFLKTKLKELAPETQAAIWEGFKNHYRDLAGYYGNLLDSKNPQEKQLGILFCRWEYENLFNALQIALNQQESVLTIINCLHSYLKLTQDTQTNLKLLEFVLETFENYPPEAKQGQVVLEIIAIIADAGSKYLQSKNYQKAKEIYQKSLELLKPISESYSQSKQSFQASTLHNLGAVAQELREWEQAQSYYQQAIEIFIEYGDRFSQASTLHHLGIVAQQLREWEQARSYYQQAIEIFIEYGDRYEQAGTLHQLGMVAAELREWEQARSYYQQALEIYIEYGARYEQASTLHNLGIVAQQLREWEQARSYYQQALEIKIEYGDRYEQASTLHQLGMVAQELREWEQARSYYQQAIEIYIEYGDRYGQAGTLHQLGRVAEEVGELSQAKSYYLQALQIWAEFNDSYTIQTFSLPRLVALYQQTQDEEIFVAVADILGVGVEEVRGLV